MDFYQEPFVKSQKKTRIPRNATLVVGALSMICAGIFPLASLAEFVNICTLAYLVIMSFAIIKLRKNAGEPQRGEFKTPFVPLLPILAIIICVTFMSQYMVFTWIAFGISTILGIVVYACYGYTHSQERRN